MDITVGQLIEALNSPNGILILFLFILATGARGIWVWGRELVHRDQQIADLTAENHELREAVYGWRTTGHEAHRLAQRAITQISEREPRDSEAPW